MMIVEGSGGGGATVGPLSGARPGGPEQAAARTNNDVIIVRAFMSGLTLREYPAERSDLN